MKTKIMMQPKMALTLIVLISISANLTQCLQYSCPDSYFFQAQHCQKCLPNCICIQENTCQSCVSGYTQFRGSCVQCPQANGIYGKCSDCCSSTTGTKLTCTDCTLVANKFSFLFSGRCILSDGCFEVDQNGFCIDCKSGFYQYDNLCFSCDSSCATCSDNNHCLTCSAGHYWAITNGGLCSDCPNGCSTCNSSGKCTTCLETFYQFNDHCLSCPSNCQTCIDGSTCTTCSQGILVSNLCILCDDTNYGGTVGCLSCQQTNNFIQCTQCADLYFLDSNGDCRKCENQIAGALRCRDANTPTQCKDDHDLVLTNRYYLVGISCIQNTKSCKRIGSFTGACSSCYEGYTLDLTATCVACPFAGCKTGNSSVLSNVCTCTQCNSGYYLSGVTCLACSTPNCATCLSNTCSACLTGFFWNGAACQASTAANCVIASSALLCSVCADGYYRGSDNNCYLCQANCLKCTDRKTCTQCAPDFLKTSGYCLAYPTNCAQISADSWNPIKCSLCNHGYYLFEGHCMACTVEKGTLSQCSGLCPIDDYIKNLLIQTSSQKTVLFTVASLIILTIFL